MIRNICTVQWDDVGPIIIFNDDSNMIAHLVSHPWSAVAAFCWLIVGLGCTAAVYSPRIDDTLMERVALSLLAVSAFSRAWYVFGRGTIPIDGALTAIAGAMLVLVLVYKHRFVLPRMKRRQSDRAEPGKKR